MIKVAIVRKKIMALFLSVCLSVFVPVCAAFAVAAAFSAETAASAAEVDARVFDPAYDTDYGFAYGSGNGSRESEPALIATAAHLNNVRNYSYNYDDGTDTLLPGGFFKVIADIDLSAFLAEGGDGHNGGKGWDPIDIAVSTFDGGGHTISGLWLDRPAEHWVGLFGYTLNAFIKNINLQLAEEGITGKTRVGGISGEVTTYPWSKSAASISGCSVTGKVTSTYNFPSPSPVSASVGLVTGSVQYATVKECLASGTATGYYGVGGIAGSVQYGDILDCRFDGDVCPTNEVWPTVCAGGIAGVCYGASVLKNCFYGGGDDSDGRVAAIAGFNGNVSVTDGEPYAVNPPEIYGCYYDADSFGNPITFIEPDRDTGRTLVMKNSSGLSKAEMQEEASFLGWDFDSVWGFDPDKKLVLRTMYSGEYFSSTVPEVPKPPESPKPHEKPNPPHLVWLWVSIGCILAAGLLVFIAIAIYRRKKPVYVTETVTETVTVVEHIPAAALPLPEILTSREKEIGLLILKGKGVELIAEELFISISTVRNHIKSILRKTDCQSQKMFILKHGNGGYGEPTE